MKIIAIIFSIILLSFTARSQHFQDSWYPTTDKIQHFSVGFIFAGLPAYSMCHYKQSELNYKRGFAYGMAYGGGVNLAKEIYDYTSNTGHASIQDLTYGMVGAAVSSVAYMGLMTLINNNYKKKQSDLEKAKYISSLVK